MWISRENRYLLFVLTAALQCIASNDSPFLEDSDLGRIYRQGSEMGLLSLSSFILDIYATDGFLEAGHMGAKVYIGRS